MEKKRYLIALDKKTILTEDPTVEAQQKSVEKTD